MNIYIDVSTVKFLLGLYALWTAVSVCLFCDWFKETTMLYPNIKIRMSQGEKINLITWALVTVLILILWML